MNFFSCDRMLDKEPANRPSASEVLKIEYIAQHLSVRVLQCALYVRSIDCFGDFDLTPNEQV